MTIKSPVSSSRDSAATPTRQADGAIAKSIPRFVDGVQAFADAFDAFVVDQWGVLHDGRSVFPHVVETLRTLLSLGKHVILLSNSGKRVSTNAARLAEMGLAETCYSALITSGEVARGRLAARAFPFVPALGERCLFLSSDANGALLEGLPVEVVPAVENADFVLLAGVADDKPMAYYHSLLESALSRHLPLICTNPDTVRFSPKGLTFSAGEVAHRYEAMGGEVHYIGKPHPAVYEFLFDRLPELDPKRSIAVGDSLFHDVVGGARAGMATAFVTGGIHRHAFATLSDESQRLARVAAIASDHGVMPDWVIPAFTW